MKDLSYYESQQNDEEFKKDLFEYFGVQDNSKKEECYRIAYDIGHAHGYSEVLYYFTDIVSLIKSHDILRESKKQEIWELAKSFGFYESECMDESNGKNYKEISTKSENFWLFIKSLLSET